MIRKITLLLLITFVATTSFAATARYMVVTKPAGGDSLQRLAANAEFRAERHVRDFRNISAYGVDLTEAEAAQLRLSPEVLSVQPVVMRQIQSIGDFTRPLVSRFEKQSIPWGISAVNVSDVWNVTRGEGVNVAVIDTGLDLTHPELQPAYAGGHNIVEPAQPPIDDHGHGTHVSGTIAAADNAYGVVGVAPNVKLWAVKVLNREGYGTDEQLAAGIDWVITKKKELGGRWVINMSLGSEVSSPAEKAAVQRAAAENIILVAASGNSAIYTLLYPAAYPEVISVGAVDELRKVADFSNYGVGLSIVAPGVEVASTYLVGRVKWANVALAGESLTAYGLGGSPYSSLSGRVINCGYGRVEDFPSEVAGKVALVKRGPIGAALLFREKARNAKEAGAIAVIVYNDDNVREWTNWTLDTNPPLEYAYPLTVSVSLQTGERLIQNSGRTVTVTYDTDDYGRLSGTSMATPHVAGVVALLLALDPEANIADIRSAMQHTAFDVNTPGWDFRTAWGMVDALAAAKRLAPSEFGLPDNTPPSSRRRSVRP